MSIEDKKNFEKNYGPEKSIMGMKMAAFLLLNGCKLNHTRIDLVRQNRYIYFFADTPLLSLLMGVYNDYKDDLTKIESKVYNEVVKNSGIKKTIVKSVGHKEVDKKEETGDHNE